MRQPNNLSLSHCQNLIIHHQNRLSPSFLNGSLFIINFCLFFGPHLESFRGFSWFSAWGGSCVSSLGDIQCWGLNLGLLHAKTEHSLIDSSPATRTVKLPVRPGHFSSDPLAHRSSKLAWPLPASSLLTYSTPAVLIALLLHRGRSLLETSRPVHWLFHLAHS